MRAVRRLRTRIAPAPLLHRAKRLDVVTVWAQCRSVAAASCECPAPWGPVFARFFISYLTVFHRFYRFLKNGREAEPHTARRCPAAPSPRLSPGGRGSKRAVGDMPKKCPCKDQRSWFFREIFGGMGTLNLQRGHIACHFCRRLEYQVWCMICVPSNG
jgi:hypothetical protein